MHAVSRSDTDTDIKSGAQLDQSVDFAFASRVVGKENLASLDNARLRVIQDEAQRFGQVAGQGPRFNAEKRKCAIGHQAWRVRCSRKAV